MSRRLAYQIGETLHLTALGVWAGALFGAGLTAAVTFPTMRDLEPTLGAYPGYTGDHWMLAAGQIASRVFLGTDIVQFVCAFLTIVGFAIAVIAGPKRRSWLQFFRAAGTGLAFLLVSYHLLLLMPPMQNDLRAYWDAAKAGDTPTAEVHRQAFSDRHGDASRSIGSTAVVTLVTLGLGLWSVSGRACEHKRTADGMSS